MSGTVNLWYMRISEILSLYGVIPETYCIQYYHFDIVMYVRFGTIRKYWKLYLFERVQSLRIVILTSKSERNLRLTIEPFQLGKLGVPFSSCHCQWSVQILLLTSYTHYEVRCYLLMWLSLYPRFSLKPLVVNGGYSSSRSFLSILCLPWSVWVIK